MAGSPGTREHAATVRILYVAGSGRSGSTLLGRMLGQTGGCTSVGELVRIWKRGAQRRVACSCGEPFRRCPLWAAVGEAAFGGWDTLDARELVALQRSVDRARYVPFMLLPAAGRGYRQRLSRYTDVLRRLYTAVADVTGADVVVDVSKRASTLFLLTRVPGVDLRVVHLVRDSRGVAYSWTKSVAKPEATGPARYVGRFHPGVTAVRYLLDNLAVWLGAVIGVPTVFLRYEDLVAAPRDELSRLLRFAGARSDELEFLARGAVQLAASHSVGGNPRRSEQGQVLLDRDDEWRTRLPRRHRLLVTAVTLPLLGAYGYLTRRGER
ncbi:MAG: sulfotransferase [Euzebyales bacterium]|nr:sulfotransferase [Euzebyales bacterium]